MHTHACMRACMCACMHACVCIFMHDWNREREEDRGRKTEKGGEKDRLQPDKQSERQTGNIFFVSLEKQNQLCP